MTSDSLTGQDGPHSHTWTQSDCRVPVPINEQLTGHCLILSALCGQLHGDLTKDE